MAELPHLVRPSPRQPRPPHATRVYAGVLFEVWRWPQEQFDGTFRDFEVLSRPDTVLVLPVLPDGSIVLASEEQPGVAPAIRALGGRIEAGERPGVAAMRELEEEAGLRASELRLWAAWQPVSKVDWAVYLFAAHGVEPAEARLDTGESVELLHFTQDQLIGPASTLRFDDYELMFHLYSARSDRHERSRVRALLRPGGSDS